MSLSSKRRVLRVFGVVSCALVALVSFRYLLGAGPVPPNVAENVFRHPWLLLHVIGAATALLVAPLQLSPALRSGSPSRHRWLGRTYVLGCTLGGVSGAVLAFGSVAGPVASAGFGLLAAAWLVATTAGWLSAARGRIAQHRAWMLRSFSLTYAAVTLRVYLAVLPLLPVTFLQGYRAIAFLCWVPNLLVAELLLRRAPERVAATSSSTSLRTSAPSCAPQEPPLTPASASPP